MDLSLAAMNLPKIHQDLKAENDTPSVVTLIPDMAFCLEQAEKYLSHDQSCATFVGPEGPYGWERGCDCGLEKLEAQISDVLLRAQEARR